MHGRPDVNTVLLDDHGLALISIGTDATLDKLARFWARIDRSGGADACWPWIGATIQGYGHVFWPGVGQYVHRVAYELLNGPVAKDLHLDHLCRNRVCANPAHLEPVAPRVNCLRGESFAGKHARQTHCKRGHEFTEANTYRWKHRRQCRVCDRERGQREHALARATMNNAVRNGRLTRKPCEVCGVAPAQGHHPRGYDNPLDVVWLCQRHHNEAHGRGRAA